MIRTVLSLFLCLGALDQHYRFVMVQNTDTQTQYCNVHRPLPATYGYDMRFLDISIKRRKFVPPLKM